MNNIKDLEDIILDYLNNEFTITMSKQKREDIERELSDKIAEKLPKLSIQKRMKSNLPFYIKENKIVFNRTNS